MSSNSVEPSVERVTVNGVELAVTVAGDGPLVVLCHGFPELAWSWRHQIPALAAAGYRVIAPDQRGYGASARPEPIDQYSILHLVGDVIGLIDHYAPGEAATVVGHDWGSMVAWSTAVMRPDRCRGVVGMSVPYMPRMDLSVVDILRMTVGDGFHYILYFQEPGVAEVEFDADPDRSMRLFLWGASAQRPTDDERFQPRPNQTTLFGDVANLDSLPPWITEAEFAVYRDAFAASGFRGGINWYRNFARNWELTAAWHGAPVLVPALFIGGRQDPVLATPEGPATSPLVAIMEASCRDLRGIIWQDNAGHWNQQEDPDGTNAALLDFLASLP
jgi:pimeloyl-ACP methyl ester carboxylesterase